LLKGKTPNLQPQALNIATIKFPSNEIFKPLQHQVHHAITQLKQ